MQIQFNIKNDNAIKIYPTGQKSVDSLRYRVYYNRRLTLWGEKYEGGIKMTDEKRIEIARMIIAFLQDKEIRLTMLELENVLEMVRRTVNAEVVVL